MDTGILCRRIGGKAYHVHADREKFTTKRNVEHVKSLDDGKPVQIVIYLHNEECVTICSGVDKQGA